MLTTETILNKLNSLKKGYEKEGIILYALFGSFAKETFDRDSDIDIAYKLNYEQFSKHYKDGFAKLLRLQNIKEELESVFGVKVDFVPYKERFEECIYV
jgi:predicted nucleotidyltransferase